MADNPYKDLVPCEGSLVDMLAQARSKVEGQQQLSDLEVVANLYVMLAAGYETTSNALACAMFCLASNKEAEGKLLEEVDAWGRDKGVAYDELGAFPYTMAVVKEVLRLYPAAPLIGRCSSADLMLGGYHIPRGTCILASVWSIMRDPAIFPDPEAFKPERWLGPDAARLEEAFMAFGVGPRSCIGYKFALEEARIALIRVYQRLTFELDRSQHPVPGVLETRVTIALKPAHGVHLVPCIRQEA